MMSGGMMLSILVVVFMSECVNGMRVIIRMINGIDFSILIIMDNMV